MDKSTADQLVTAAAQLLAGGLNAVSVRAVAKLVGVSQSAPYKHFKNRDALLAAVAARDFVLLKDVLEQARSSTTSPLAALKTAIAAFIDWGRQHPVRYRLMFSYPELASQRGAMEARAMEAFRAFGALVANCQSVGALPPTDSQALTALLYSSLHGLMDLGLGGLVWESKGLDRVEALSNLLLDLISTSSG
jgi:AcrR family transcriptional regulator